MLDMHSAYALEIERANALYDQYGLECPTSNVGSFNRVMPGNNSRLRTGILALPRLELRKEEVNGKIENVLYIEGKDEKAIVPKPLVINGKVQYDPNGEVKLDKSVLGLLTYKDDDGTEQQEWIPFHASLLWKAGRKLIPQGELDEDGFSKNGDYKVGERVANNGSVIAVKATQVLADNAMVAITHPEKYPSQSGITTPSLDGFVRITIEVRKEIVRKWNDDKTINDPEKRVFATLDYVK